MTPEEILALPMQDNDADAPNIREYLKTLLLTLWNDGESFSGKRPFGNSGWTWEVFIPLIKAGVVSGSLDSNGYVEDVDEIAANTIIQDLIKSL